MKILSILTVLAVTACSSTYYRALETFGIEKRDILVDRIDDTRSAQEAAKEQFADALEQYRSVVDFDGGDLEGTYDRLNRVHDRSVYRAEAVSARIDAVEDVAEDLFDEWGEEIETFTDARLARRSRQLLAATRNDYASLITAMHRAEQSMEPVLALFTDQVLFLRHNLNARAIGALQTELDSIENATMELVAEMERAIDEATRFINQMS